jgi:hypothetical protein
MRRAREETWSMAVGKTVATQKRVVMFATLRTGARRCAVAAARERQRPLRFRADLRADLEEVGGTNASSRTDSD